MSQKLDSPAVCRERAARENDGSHSREPYMRLSQIILEAWLKQLTVHEPLIQGRWGWTFKSLVEDGERVASTVQNPQGDSITITSKFVIGCDGGGSKVRAAAGLEARRRPLYVLPLTSRSHANLRWQATAYVRRTLSLPRLGDAVLPRQVLAPDVRHRHGSRQSR